MMNNAQQEVGRRNEVRVENGNKLTLRRLQTLVQRARFISRAIAAMQISDRMPLRRVMFHKSTSHIHRLVG